MRVTFPAFFFFFFFFFLRKLRTTVLLTARLSLDSCYFLLVLCIKAAGHAVLNKHPQSTLLTLARKHFSEPYKTTGKLCGRATYCLFSYRQPFFIPVATYFTVTNTTHNEKSSKHLKHKNNFRFFGTLIVGPDSVIFHEIRTSEL
jgi:hypothetical protein